MRHRRPSASTVQSEPAGDVPSGDRARRGGVPGGERDRERGRQHHPGAPEEHRTPADRPRQPRQRRAGQQRPAGADAHQQARDGREAPLGEPVAEGLQGAHQDAGEAEAEQRPADRQQGGRRGGREDDRAQHRRAHERRHHPARPPAVERAAERQLREGDGAEEDARHEPELRGVETELGAQLGRDHRVGGAEEVRQQEGREPQREDAPAAGHAGGSLMLSRPERPG